MTKLFRTTNDLKSELAKRQKSIGFVATMGALHKGHRSLIERATKECMTTVVSIFVNPFQFGPNEDFNAYPRSLDEDMKVCESEKVDIVFLPDEKEIYPTEASKKELIIPPVELTGILCGRTRSGHFESVATVVKKFFDIIHPDYIYFGEKDLQQLFVIRWLVKEYDLAVTVQACPTVREANGLACSSRNQYLSGEQKEAASNIYKSLKLAKQNIKSGIFTVSRSILESLVFLSVQPELKVEYFEAKDKENLGKVDDRKTQNIYFLTACNIKGVRLIDNIEV